MSEENNRIPADTAKFLEGELPRYQSGGKWVINGQAMDMNTLANPFDPPAKRDKDSKD